MMRRFVTGMAAAAVCRTHALPGVGGLCPPSITVATFRALKSSGRGVGRSTAPGPKRAAQDMEALFDQYMAIVSARGASPMVNAEAAKSFITEHFEANEERTYFLGFLGAFQISDSPISAKAWSEAFAKLTPRRVVEDGTFLAAPSSQFRVTHNTSVTMLGLRDDLLAQRHVTTMDWDRRGAAAILNSIRSCHPLCPVGIIRGASGTGKTLDAVLTAVCDESVAAACARFTPSHFRSAIDEIEAIGDSDKAARNEKVRTCVMQLVEQVVPEGYREPPATTKARFVLFFDEVGAYPQFVRGLCAVSSRLAADIRTAFVGTVAELLILAGGTGVEGTDHAAGSEPSSYVILQRKTDVWETITKTWKEAKADLKKRIDDRVSHAASLARDVVMNPRAAALFCEVVDNESDLLVTDGFMKRATQDACVKFKRRNGLRDLSWSEYLQIMCEAFAAQHTLELSPQAFDRLAREYGVLTDNAQRSASPQKGSILVPGTEETALATIPLQRAPSPTVVNRLLLKAIEVARQSKSILLQRKMEPVTTHLYVPPNEPRYMLDAAQAAMVLVAFDLGDRPPTGGGFEEAGMDYTALSVKTAYASLDGSWWSPSFRVHVGVDSELPPNWRRPIAVVDFLRDVLKGTEPPASIIIKTLEHQVSLGAPAASVMKTFGLDRMSPSDLMSPGRFWLNQANGAGPDGFCFVGKRVLLLQFKYHPRTSLSEWNVFEELYKLGMRTDECVVAAWIQNFSKGKTQLPTSYVIAQSNFEQKLLNEKYAEAFGEICDSQYGELKSFASALRAETSVAERAPFIEVFERQGLKPTFVVMHYGLPPQGVRQKFDGLDVLLVTAAHPQSTNALGMLDDYFPIKISEPHRRHITLPLEVVPKPR